MAGRLVSGRKTALCALVGLLCSPLAWAVSPGDQDLIRDRQDRLLEEQQRRLEELRNLPGKAAEPGEAQPATDSRCFTIHTIELKGADSLSAADRDGLLKPFIDQCLGVTQLNALLKAITDHYLGRGLVTSRAYLPQQDLSSGHLQVLVVEGRLEGLRPDSNSGLSDRELAMAFPGAIDQRLNLREIEQMVDQLNRLPSNKAQMELTPGKAVGGSEVLVRNTQQKPWRASLSRNNEGQRSTGEQMLNLGLEWDSPLGLADQLMLRGGHDVVSDHTQGSKNGVLFYNLPWGWWNFTYSYSESEYRSLAQANGFAFKQTGDSQNHQLRAERVVHRDATSKTSLNAGMAHLRTNNYIEDSRLEGSSNRLSEAQFGINHGRRLGNAFVNLDLGTQEGIGAFDAQDNGHPRRGQPVARYRKYSATLSYVQGFQLLGERLSFSSLATGQRSEDVLFSPQRISLGGLSSVRGLKDQSLSGDSGGYWRNDLRWTRPVNWPLLQPLVAEYGLGLGYDLGVIRNDRYNGEYHGRASSHSLELFARGQHMAASVTFAHSLERPDVLTEKERPVYFRLDFFI
ncbi:ShlB/FhaC/HecB family hemolysin secretion/activation protein [Pseudomonas mosselii]|uniref:ShlB/FhaC/HecB family hemolysin secretion/activation protein n=1 Tax=Pseudomonas mosselii TaxID=78327 RepID=UPI002447FE66|nr:ShlB/FhaC/HecB family hemolysin secretion/activation protein [Pseudomonas mosselii]MDH0629115.1 ShlB/FhaC/HecB family hemolysin secretion/activation protein [Pseudomonas mosselii]MDH0678219.1 ShlB/FhaC/HecB family hemolysin secretion/activation protein [Pseudomonas mosselii]MDH0925997.1 ShlB/FhaC/HecB family hemolysin secretion/activation protein [Pseudomonas mosselii]MDH1135875.1 ShlB/FhaC/HecB family hemolysin secretion/activation protein [Pseudomonas mosselii]MDH1142399.1 ShlB/FhaC/HecB 